MGERAVAYGQWYYCIYLLMRMICWFAMGLIVDFILQIVMKDVGNGLFNSMTFGTVFSMVGGFFLGVYHIIIEE